MDDKNKRKRIQNLLMFAGLVSGVSNYTVDTEPAVDEEDMVEVPPYDFFGEGETDD